MNISKEKKDAATSQNTRHADKKATNIKVNPIINFQIGLIAALVPAFLIIEMTTPMEVVEPRIAKTVPIDVTDTNMGPVTIVPNDPIPQPKVKKRAPVVVKPKVDPNKPPVIVDDEEPGTPDTDTKVSEPIDTTPVNTTNTDVGATAKSDAPATNAAPMKAVISSVHEVPLFPGCSARMDRSERVDCLNKKMARFIQKKFNTSLADNLDGEKLVKISVMFTIGVDGLPKDILVKAPNEELRKEAYKVISRLPEMTPGKIDNMPVNMTYALPIRFQVRD